VTQLDAARGPTRRSNRFAFGTIVAAVVIGVLSLVAGAPWSAIAMALIIVSQVVTLWSRHRSRA
jgi:phosphatidylglycerophosphate synthase